MQSVSPFEGTWLIERDVKIHGSFQRKEIVEFDNFNPKSKQYQFFGNLAVLPEFFKLKSKIIINADKSSKENHLKAKNSYKEDLSKSEIEAT